MNIVDYFVQCGTTAILNRNLPKLADERWGGESWFGLVMSVSFTRIRPLVGRRMPARVFAKVDFPAPFGPTIAVTSPASTETDTSRMTGERPYPEVMFSAVNAGIEHSS